LGGAFEIFILAAPLNAIALGQLHLGLDSFARGIDIAAQVAAIEINIDIVHRLGILCADRRRAFADAHRSDLAERNGGAARRGHKHILSNGLGIVAVRLRIADDHAIAFAAFNRLCRHFSAQRAAHDSVNVLYGKAVTG
jgi:hypothetical protein